MTLLDTSGVFAALRDNDVYHAEAGRALATIPRPLLLSPLVLGELDYMISRDLGTQAELQFLHDVSAGAYTITEFSSQDLEDALQILHRFADLAVGLADASIVVLAARYRTRDVFTFDRRHFRARRTLDGQPFRLLPDDLQP